MDDEEKLLMGCVRLALLDSKKSPVGYVRGALISGPSGCGKTCLVRRVAQYFASEVNLVSASAAEVLSSTPGATERAIRQLFTFARAAAPTILVLENIEVLSPSRDGQNHSNNPFRRVLTTLLTQLDGMDTSEEHVRKNNVLPGRILTVLFFFLSMCSGLCSELFPFSVCFGPH